MILLNFKCACFILLYSFLQQCCVSPTGRGLIPIEAPVGDCSQYQDEEWCVHYGVRVCVRNISETRRATTKLAGAD